MAPSGPWTGQGPAALVFDGSCYALGLANEGRPSELRYWMGGAMGVTVCAILVAEGWLWTEFARRLASGHVATGWVAGGLYCACLMMIFCAEALRESARNPSVLLLWVLGVVWAIPGVWALISALRWAWMNPLF